MLHRIADFVASHPRIVMLTLVFLIAFFAWATLWLLLRCILALRKMTHAERLQMIEAGQSIDLLRMREAQAKRNRFFSIAMALALFVPATALIGATLVTICTEGVLGVSIVAWSSAVVASLASTICATLVMGRQKNNDRNADKNP